MGIEKKLHELSDRVISMEKDMTVEVLATFTDSSLTRFVEGSIHQNVNEETVVLSVALSEGKKSATVNIEKFDDESIKKSLDACKKSLKLQKDDPEAVDLLKDIELGSDVGYDEKTANLTPEFRAEVVKKIAEIGEEKGLNVCGIVKNDKNVVLYKTSTGMSIERKSTSASYSLSAFTKNSAGWASRTNWCVDNIDFDEVNEIATQKALVGVNPQPKDQGRYTVVLEPNAVIDLLMFYAYAGAFNGKNHEEKTSPFTGKVGEKLFSDKLTVTEEINHPLNPQADFTFEGVEKKELTLIENGVLKNILYDYRTAKNYGKEPTGNGFPANIAGYHGAYPSGMVVKKGSKTTEELIKSVDNGILVTHFHYTNMISPRDMMVTGMTRDGVFRIENGKVVEPLKNFRFTQSLNEAFSNIIEIGSEEIFDSSFFGGAGIVAPAMVIENFNFTSSTEF